VIEENSSQSTDSGVPHNDQDIISECPSQTSYRFPSSLIFAFSMRCCGYSHTHEWHSQEFDQQSHARRQIYKHFQVMHTKVSSPSIHVLDTM
jgi:hypothetical protein